MIPEPIKHFNYSQSKRGSASSSSCCNFLLNAEGDLGFFVDRFVGNNKGKILPKIRANPKVKQSQIPRGNLIDSNIKNFKDIAVIF